MTPQKLHVRKPISPSGYTELVSPQTTPLRHISLGILRIPRGGHQVFEPEARERTLVILGGSCLLTSRVHEDERVGLRPDVFSGKASAVYLPPGQGASIKAESELELALVATAADATDDDPRIIRPEDVRHRHVGRANWSRDVYDIIDKDFPAHNILLGETINPPGNWSGSPAHKHDQDNSPHETAMEEVYFYRVEPAQGFGIQRIYTAGKDMDCSYAVEQNDVIVIPRGYHPVVAAPGYRLYYLWILAGKERTLAWHEDPAHNWIHEQ